MSGYPMQAWTIATSAFEAAHAIGFVGNDKGRAERWLSHSSQVESFIPTFDAVMNTIIYLGIESDVAKREALVQESFGIYRHLCMAKHVNPIVERERYIYGVEGRPNLLLSPVFTRRRAAEARLGLLLAIRSACIALWAIDVTHLAEPGFVDDGIAAIMLEIDELVGSWKDDIVLSLEAEQ